MLNSFDILRPGDRVVRIAPQGRHQLAGGQGFCRSKVCIDDLATELPDVNHKSCGHRDCLP